MKLSSKQLIIAALVAVAFYILFMKPKRSGFRFFRSSPPPPPPPPPPPKPSCGFPGSINQASGCPCDANTQCKSGTCRWTGKCA